ncbi:MAG TPA: winged helix-turn-helix domain-containing protein [Pirellulales bacterium]|nr:winged helix-turn-helix domain-containing protein [Pirellulales bacterium]
MSCITQIGETAGTIWQVLNAKGSLTIAKLVKEIEAPRDVVMQGLGWLAREDKIAIDEEARTRVVSLKD